MSLSRIMRINQTTKLFGVAAGLVLTIGITWAAFTWGVYYARNTPHPQVLSVELDRNLIITNEFVKVMNNASDSVAFAIWHGGYLYTPDTAMFNLVMFGH